MLSLFVLNFRDYSPEDSEECTISCFPGTTLRDTSSNQNTPSTLPQGSGIDPQQQPPTDAPATMVSYQIDPATCQCQCRGQFDRKFAGDQCVSNFFSLKVMTILAGIRTCKLCHKKTDLKIFVVVEFN